MITTTYAVALTSSSIDTTSASMTWDQLRYILAVHGLVLGNAVNTWEYCDNNKYFFKYQW